MTNKNDPIIQVKHLSKEYKIGVDTTYKTLSESITDTLRSPLSVLKNFNKQNESYWALKDINFEVNRGEVVGIIGKNGAGKSTLLKVLSRITHPTEGEVRLRGRVGSLLEVGTGFHPELTGRENVYFNGAILGMKKREIEDKFEEIVKFSGVEKFLDTPVKRYSSGMYVRLAFAVAAHMDPEILIVDEVLAVGDAAFQKKCLGKMGEVAEGGRTVLFVSHNMASVTKLCGKAILLSNGQVEMLSDVEDVIAEYDNKMQISQKMSSFRSPILNHQYGLILESVKVHIIPEGKHAHLHIEVQLKSKQCLRHIGIGVWVHTCDGFLIAKLGPALTNNVIEEVKGTCLCILQVKNIEQYLASGDYSISIAIAKPKIETLIFAENVAIFNVPPYDIYGSGVPYVNSMHGIVPLPIKLLKIHST